MDKIKFNHKAKQLDLALGLSDKRGTEILNGFVAAMKKDNVKKFTEAVEVAIKELKIKSASELIWLGYVFGKVKAKHDRVANMAEGLMSIFS